MEKLRASFAAMLLILVFVGCKLYVPSEDTGLTFGSFPQAIKKSRVTVNESESKVVGMFTYYKGSDGEWYAKLGNEYYKVQPIKWHVLTENFNGKKLLLSEKILMNCMYYDFRDVNRVIEGNTVYPNNYKESRVRAYLNGLSYQVKSTRQGTQLSNSEFLGKGFLQTAFTADEQAKIATTMIDNSARSTNLDIDPTFWNDGNNDYACENTYDKIFLLSEQEVTKSEYGFTTSDVTRIRKATDFAKACGVSSSSDGYEGGYWSLRSPSSSDGSGYNFIGDRGLATQPFRSYVDDTRDGVCPALVVQF